MATLGSMLGHLTGGALLWIVLLLLLLLVVFLKIVRIASHHENDYDHTWTSFQQKTLAELVVHRVTNPPSFVIVKTGSEDSRPDGETESGEAEGKIYSPPQPNPD